MYRAPFAHLDRWLASGSYWSGSYVTDARCGATYPPVEGLAGGGLFAAMASAVGLAAPGATDPCAIAASVETSTHTCEQNMTSD